MSKLIIRINPRAPMMLPVITQSTAPSSEKYKRTPLVATVIKVSVHKIPVTIEHFPRHAIEIPRAIPRLKTFKL